MSDMRDSDFTVGKSKTYGWSINRGHSTTGSTSEDDLTQDILADVDVGCVQADKLHLDINLRSFRTLLRRAVRRLSVAQFAELRRRFDQIWLDILEEL
jgi:hypothetical protein